MRIIAGQLGGRTFQSPKGHRTHPMSDKVRGAIFNILGDIDGLTILDAFAGSGALSYEAVSRGAKNAVAIEIDKNAHKTIQENIKALGLSNQVKAIRASAGSWSDTNDDARFDIILCDPPYDDLQLRLIQKLGHHISEKGLLVLSWPGSKDQPPIAGLEIATSKSYGDAQLVFYAKAR